MKNLEMAELVSVQKKFFLLFIFSQFLEYFNNYYSQSDYLIG